MQFNLPLYSRLFYILGGSCLLYTSPKEEDSGLEQELQGSGLFDEYGSGLGPVSYTHLDVYKRQAHIIAKMLQLFHILAPCQDIEMGTDRLQPL